MQFSETKNITCSGHISSTAQSFYKLNLVIVAFSGSQRIYRLWCFAVVCFDLYLLFKFLNSRFREQHWWESEKITWARAWGRTLQHGAFWTWQSSCNHELTVAVLACIRPAQDHANQLFGLEEEGLRCSPHWGIIGSCCLLQKEELIFFRRMITGQLTMLHWTAPHQDSFRQ